MIKHMTLNAGFKNVLMTGDFNHPKILWTPSPVVCTNHLSDEHPDVRFVNAQFNKVYRFWEFCNITLSTDAIFLPLTRAWGGEGYDEAVGGGRVVTRAGRARINDFLFLKFPKSVYFIKFCVLSYHCFTTENIPPSSLSVFLKNFHSNCN